MSRVLHKESSTLGDFFVLADWIAAEQQYKIRIQGGEKREGA